MNNFIDRYNRLSRIKKWLLKFVVLTIIITLILRFTIPYFRIALGVDTDSIRFFLIGMMAIPLLLIIVMAIVKKKFYVEFLAVVISTIIANAIAVEIWSSRFTKLGNNYYVLNSDNDIGGKIYNRWGVELWNYGYGSSCVALVENEDGEELILSIKKRMQQLSDNGFLKYVFSHYEVHTLNLSTDDSFVFEMDKTKVNVELEKRKYLLIDYIGINPFSEYQNNSERNPDGSDTDAHYDEEDNDEYPEEFNTPVISFVLEPPTNYGEYWNEQKTEGTRYSIVIYPDINDYDEPSLFCGVYQRPYSSGTETTNTIPQEMDPTGGMFGGIIDVVNSQNVYNYGDDDVKIVCSKLDGRTLSYTHSFPSQKQTMYPIDPYEVFHIHSKTGCEVECCDKYEVFFNGSLIATYDIPSEGYFNKFLTAGRNNDRLFKAYLANNMEQYNQLIQMQMNDYNSEGYDKHIPNRSILTTPEVEKYCHLCKGSGACVTCGGDGLYDGIYGTGTQVCPNCTAPNHRCSSCGGTGRE